MTTEASRNTDAANDTGDRPLTTAFLRRLRIRGYKSIAFCDVTLNPLTIFVGRNASGKSNFLDALAFLRDLMKMQATEAVNERRGWRSIHCRNAATPHIDMALEATFRSHRSTWNGDYSFSLEIGEHNQIRVRHESLILTEEGRDRRCGFRVAQGKLEWIGSQHFKNGSEEMSEVDISELLSEGKLTNPRFFATPRYDRLLLGVIGTQPFLNLAEKLRASCVYNFSPPEIRVHQPMTASPILVRDGSNLARAIEGLREIEPETIDRIRNYLCAIVDGVEGFETVSYGDYETVQFSLASTGSGGSPTLFDASSMSDGTLRILAALVAAYQIVLPAGFPGFIGIEEPETALHPAAMRALVDALDEATLRTQVFLTTHSAEMLDNPTIGPENVRVVEIIDGKTIVGPVDEASVEIIRQKLDTLGGLERQDQLEPRPAELNRDRQLSQDCLEPKG